MRPWCPLKRAFKDTLNAQRPQMRTINALNGESKPSMPFSSNLLSIHPSSQSQTHPQTPPMRTQMPPSIHTLSSRLPHVVPPSSAHSKGKIKISNFFQYFSVSKESKLNLGPPLCVVLGRDTTSLTPFAEVSSLVPFLLPAPARASGHTLMRRGLFDMHFQLSLPHAHAQGPGSSCRTSSVYCSITVPGLVAGWVRAFARLLYSVLDS